uniref:Uncharacterized protein n=1 Tax=Caenorhabditis japonica TaxID=281687 RepID=A0A8R1ECS4_CAEJA
MEVVQNSSASNFPKSVMNVIRRALSFRSKRSSQDSTESSAEAFFEMQRVVPALPATAKKTPKKRINSLPNSEVASTSASCSNSPSVYEDPFVAVTADGTIYVKHYYNYHNKAEFHLENIRIPQVKRNSRVIKAKDVVKVYYAEGQSCKDEFLCKSWGCCINNVWWASHLNRMEGGNTYTNVVLIDDSSSMYAGFSVINIDAFAESIQCVGLPKDAPFQSGLPSPPISMLKIPYIDEDEDDVPKKRKPRHKHVSSSNPQRE